jgi:transposase-like protein
VAVPPEKMEAVIRALDDGASKAAVCRTFGIARSALAGSLARAGWHGHGGSAVPEQGSANPTVAPAESRGDVQS